MCLCAAHDTSVTSVNMCVRFGSVAALAATGEERCVGQIASKTNAVTANYNRCTAHKTNAGAINITNRLNTFCEITFNKASACKSIGLQMII